MITWKRKSALYSNGINAYLGQFIIGSIDWDSCSNDKNLKYKVTTRLPGLKTTLGNFKTEEEGKAKLAYALDYWLDKTGLTQIESKDDKCEGH